MRMRWKKYFVLHAPRDCFPMIWKATEGQPWLVNALGYEVTEKMRENRDRTIRIIPEMIYRAQENIIYRRDTHIDILIDKLREDRVRRVIEPMLSGEEGDAEDNLRDDDIQYVADMGLVVRDKPLRISNAIYRMKLSIRLKGDSILGNSYFKRLLQ